MSKLLSAAARETAIAEMTTAEFVRLLKERHVQVQAHEGRLKINAPAGVVDARLRAELKVRKATLLEALGKAAAETGAGADADAGPVPLSAAELAGRVPLTPAQQGMWLIDHFNPGDVAYNIPEAFLPDDPMELGAMQQAVDMLVARHSVLRTSFHEEDGELFQSIAATVETPVGFTDLSSLPGAEGERLCRASISNEAQRAFNLKQAPLVRFHLYRLRCGRQVVFFNIHHIIADRTSLYLLREELTALVKSVEGGTNATLPALPLQFADYCAWVERRMSSDLIARQTAYWKSKLEGLPDFIELPHRRPRQQVRSSSGATRQVIVPAAERAAMDRIGAREGASPFMTFLAFFAASLARWSQSAQEGRVDFCIGSPITHRKQAATQRMVGPFVNMLAFRCQVGPGMGFRDVIRQVRGTALEAYENGDVPFQRLVRAINPDRRSRRSPIFQVMFGYETYAAPVANGFPMETDSVAARYDLSLHLWETADGGLRGTIEYCTDLFDPAEIDRLGAEGDALFAEICRDPDRDIFAVPMNHGVEDKSARTNGPTDGAKVEDRVFQVPSKSRAKGGLFLKTAQLLSGITMGRGKNREGVPAALEERSNA